MPTLKTCGECGAEIASDAAFGLCRSCLFAAAMRGVEADQVGLAEKSSSFGDYQLGRQIGRGGMGVVYEAVQRSLRRTVALKMILDSEAAAPAARRRFTIEAGAAAKLDHPNIVPIYEVGDHDGHPFFSMKLIAGENLRKKIASGELCLAPKDGGTSKTDLRDRVLAVTQLLATIARAVHHAHSNNVLHRDLKPANILVDTQGRPHLTDFGLAKLLEPSPETTPPGLTASGTALGTPCYMSPEQAAGQRLTAASDVYSLGAILYEMLTGEPPFRANSIWETLRMVAEQTPVNPIRQNVRVSKDLDTICMKCLEKNPDMRYPTAEALAEDLERSLRAEPIRARRVGLVPRTVRWVKRNPVGAGFIASLCACLAISLTLLYFADKRSRELKWAAQAAAAELEIEIDSAWENPEVTFFPIPSKDLAIFRGEPARQPAPDAVRLTFGLNIADNPVSQASQYARFLGELEKRTERLLKRQVLFTLQLYKARSWETLNGSRKGVDVQSMTFLTYVRLKEAEPNVQPLVTEKIIREAVLFARKDAGISNLAQVTGHRVAFAHTNSIISFLAKTSLAQAGVCAGALKAYTNLSAPRFNAPKNLSRKFENDSEGEALGSETFAHREVIARVLKGEFEAGVAPYRRFFTRSANGSQLVELHRYQNPPDVYVARSGLDAKTAHALQDALLSLKDPELLGQTKPGMRDGFQAVSDSDFDAFRKLRANEWVFFETCQGPTSPRKIEARTASTH